MTGIGRSLKPLTWLMAMLLPALVAGCGGGGGSSGPAAANPAGAVCTQGAACVDLATAGTYVILAQAGITNVPTSAIGGNVGASPITGAAIGVTCAEVAMGGKIYDDDGAYTGGGGADVSCRVTDAPGLTTAVADSITAFGDAAGRTPTEPADSLGAAGDIGGLTIGPGVHAFSGVVSMTSDVTLNGSATDVWIFQVSGNLTEDAGIKVILAGGARPQNIFWQVAGGGGAAIGAGADFKGVIIASNGATLGAAATMDGRIYTGGGTTLSANTVTRP